MYIEGISVTYGESVTIEQENQKMVISPQDARKLRIMLDELDDKFCLTSEEWEELDKIKAEFLQMSSGQIRTFHLQDVDKEMYLENMLREDGSFSVERKNGVIYIARTL